MYYIMNTQRFKSSEIGDLIKEIFNQIRYISGHLLNIHKLHRENTLPSIPAAVGSKIGELFRSILPADGRKAKFVSP